MIGFEIKYGSPLHARILNALLTRYEKARREVQKKYADWARTDDLYAAYIKLNEDDRSRQQKYKAGKPDYVTIVIPYAYAAVMAAHTYMASVFLSRNPVFQFSARHGANSTNVQAVEALVDYQVEVGGMLPPLYIWLLDTLKYGYGIQTEWWEQEQRTIAEIVEVPTTVFGMPIGKPQKKKVTRTIAGYQGNKILNIKPHEFFSDPRVPLLRFQEGEFCGHVIRQSFNYILKHPEYFNKEELKRTQRAQIYPDIATPDNPEARGNIPVLDFSNWIGDDYPMNFHYLINMTVDLVPKDWGLGNGSMPEKWVFTIADKTIIVGARPRGEIHGQFPYSIMQHELNGYDLTSRSMMEMIEPINNAMTWSFNSHMYAVRKALNDNMVYDPSRMSSRDLEEGGPARLVRLLPTAFGSDPRIAFAQLPIVDMTQANLHDIAMLMDLGQRVSGATDNVMGAINKGGEKTATEIRSANSFSINRLKTLSEFNSSLGWSPFAQRLLQNSQQYMDAGLKLKIAGDLVLDGPKFMDVTPELIAGFYDFVAVDGTLPVDRFAQANLWKEILSSSQQMAFIAQGYDLNKMFGWMAQLAGLKEINQFKIQIQSPEAIAQQAAMGNLAPLPRNAGPMPTPPSVPPSSAAA